MKQREDKRPSGAATAASDGNWKTRLLALNALVEVARQHAVEDQASRADSYRLEHALSAVNDAVSTSSHADPTVSTAVTAFGETLASPGTATEQQQ